MALVNWKGLIYEELELDHGVTALEGENGAGKTTAMIAAYAVLLPDLGYLHFHNVGESGSSGGDAGIYGRLGQPGPAYAWLDIELPRQRVIAGVLLDRKARPKLEVAPFLFEDVPPELPMADLVMRRTEGEIEVPEPQDIASIALAAGARPRSFGNDKKEYFAALFDLGITPLRMATGEERKKLDDMLRTCMMGGISDVLRTGLRDFLFAENTRLADTVKRMEQNLALCRDTRAKVTRSEQLQQEIGQLYEAGEQTFLHAVHGIAVWEREARENVERLTQEERQKQVEHDRIVDQSRQVKEELALASHEDGRLEERVGLATERIRLIERALIFSEQLGVARENEGAAQRLVKEELGHLKRAERDLQRIVIEEARVRSEATEASRHLSAHQEAYAALSMKVGQHRVAVRRLDRARELLELDSLSADDIERCLEDARTEEERVTSHYRELDLRLRDAENHARLHAEGLTCLARLLDREATVADLPAARELKSVLRLGHAQLPHVEAAAQEAGRMGAEQQKARLRAAELGVHDGAGLRHAIHGLGIEEAGLQRRLGDHREERTRTEARLTAIGVKQEQLREERAPWIRVRSELGTIAHRHRAVSTSQELLDLRAEVRVAHRQAEAALRVRRDALARIRGRIRELEMRADQPEHVLAARELLDGEIVAEHFDEVPVEAAAALQAWLGPRAHALLVDQPRRAAHQISQSDVLPAGQEILLLRGLPEPPGELDTTAEGAVLVPEGAALRVARPPIAPLLGRAARARALEALESQLRTEEAKEDKDAADLELLATDLEVVESCLPLSRSLDQPDPRPDIDQLQAESDRLSQAILDLDVQVERDGAELDRVSERLTKLRELLPEAALLDPPDRSERARVAEARLTVARRDSQRWLQTQVDWKLLGERELDLRTEPLDPETAQKLGEKRKGYLEQRGLLAEAIENLAELSLDARPLGWGHHESAFSQQTSLTPQLEEACKVAGLALEDAVERLEATREARNEAKNRAGEAEVALKLAAGKREQLESQLLETGMEAPTPAMLEESRGNLVKLRKQREELSKRVGDLMKKEGGLEQELEGVSGQLTDLQDRLGTARNELGNRSSAWGRFRDAALAERLSLDALLERAVEAQGSVNLFSEAKARCSAVAHLLRRSAAEDLIPLYEAIGEGTREHHVKAWASLRSELHRRIPPDISEAPDVVQRLHDLGRRLQRLRRTLKEREDDLRTDAKHIGTTIRSQRNRAFNMVRSLALSLADVRFGSIARITLAHEPVRKMDDLLSALSDQTDLFSGERPVEQLMVELFESIGGGKVRASRLLDYRQYFHVRVEAVRDDGSRVGARGDQMSTGEAIGIGASVMMVVLQAWEKHSAKLRKRHDHGPMRLLFLDEATRLSPKSLLVLFDLCSKLQLQLLIAAPEVARVAGGTTYTLVRHKDRVDIHGRRVVQRGLGQ